MATYAPPGQGLATNTDREVKDLAGVEPNREGKGRSGRTKIGEAEAIGDNLARALPWRAFLLRHPDYDADYWRECRALYAGGKRLLGDCDLLQQLMPPHNAEAKEVYKERCARAHYFAYAGAIIDHLVAGLGADPISIQANTDDDELDSSLPDWWLEWMEDVSAEGGKRHSLQQLAMGQIREALITGRSWTLVDLPQTPEEYVDSPPESLLEQEKRGLLDPYCIAIEPEYVIDWQDDQNGELEWALICDAEFRRESIGDDRRFITKTFTLYDREGWKRWRITYDPKTPPKADTPVEFLDEGQHPFGKVPLLRLDLPDGLWAMGKLHSLAREHLNKRNAQAWAEYKSLYKHHYEFLAAEDPGMTPISQAQQDPGRAMSQVYGQGYVQERGHQDRVEFIGPDVAPFAEARESCDQIMREMHRVMFSMALSVDTASSAIRRSGESKAQDKAVAMVVLRALGVFLRDMIRDAVELVQVVKGEISYRVSGAERFDAVDVASAVKEAVELLNGVPIKSPTFKRAYLQRLYKLVMGDELTEQQLADIRHELETQISAEESMLEDSMALMATGQQNALDDEDEDEDEGEARDREEAQRRARQGKQVKPGGRSRLFSSAG